MQNYEAIKPVFDTLSRYDSLRTTICVGGAAMAVQLHEAGADVAPQADVDVLCSKEYFEAKCAEAPSLPGVTTKIREPYGTSVRALSLVLSRGFAFLSIAKLLVWSAISGRAKDIAKVDALLPTGLQYGPY